MQDAVEHEATDQGTSRRRHVALVGWVTIGQAEDHEDDAADRE